MEAGTYCLAKHEIKVIEVLKDVIKHGFGNMEIIISEVRGEFKTKVIVKAGRSWIFYIDKEMPEFNETNIL